MPHPGNWRATGNRYKVSSRGLGIFQNETGGWTTLQITLKTIELDTQNGPIFYYVNYVSIKQRFFCLSVYIRVEREVCRAKALLGKKESCDRILIISFGKSLRRRISGLKDIHKVNNNSSWIPCMHIDNKQPRVKTSHLKWNVI